jgi:hypothetical protein
MSSVLAVDVSQARGPFFDAYLKGAGVSRLKISSLLYPEIEVLE